jgi:hypothetical protein
MVENCISQISYVEIRIILYTWKNRLFCILVYVRVRTWAWQELCFSLLDAIFYIYEQNH